ncbi:hypothetical protein QUW14_16005 [Bacteroides gallinaceum]|uniref:hypothetical protein n=1 Tax=Bacteroides gallinaceum TaxID=1462571 RepID=UPI0025A4C149|nr:hypothetical protein [Bacteroides gallinaceum]MDM8155777.1 hypothetical protein [Bacteroides gallinaceum]
MEKDYIYNVLLGRGYDEKSAQLVAVELMDLSQPLDAYLVKWMQDESDMQDYSLHDYSIKQLMEERNMAYPAALLTMDWLIKEPDAAVASLKRGIK